MPGARFSTETTILASFLLHFFGENFFFKKVCLLNWIFKLCNHQDVKRHHIPLENHKKHSKKAERRCLNTAFACATLLCLRAWSQVLAAPSTTAWQGVGTGSCTLLFSSSTSDGALCEVRPLGITTVNSY